MALKKKKEQLGMHPSTAAGRLRKAIMFEMVQQLNRDICYRCGEKIEDIDNLSVEHKIPWLDSEDPVGLYFDLDNIAFSHKACNYGAARNVKLRSPVPNHGTYARYRHRSKPCRCTDCKEANRLYSRKWDEENGRTSH